MLSVRGRALSAGAGFMPFCGCIDQLLDTSCHVGELISPQPVQLFCCRLSGSQILERWSAKAIRLLPRLMGRDIPPRRLSRIRLSVAD